MLIRTLGSIGVASALWIAGPAHAQDSQEATPLRLASAVASLEKTPPGLSEATISPAVLIASPYARMRIPESWLPPLATRPLPAPDAIDRRAWAAVERRLLRVVWAAPMPALPQLVDLPLATFVVEVSEGMLFEMIDEAEPSIDDQELVRDPHAELEWLLRQKRRSVLERRGQGAPRGRTSLALERAAPWIPEVTGTVEYSTTAPALSHDESGGEADVRSSGGLLRIQGRLPNDGRWTVGGVMHASEGTSWQGHTEIVAQVFNQHELMAATAWGSRLLTDRPEEATPALQGSVYVQDRWSVSRSLAVIGSGRYSYVGYLDRPHYLDPGFALEWVPLARTRLRLGGRMRTLVPGGESLALSAFVPVSGVMVNSFTAGRLGRASRLEASADHAPGATAVGGHAFVEDVVDPSIHVLASAADPRPQSVMLGGHLHRYGAGASIRQRLGHAASVSFSYTLGRSNQIVGPALVYAPGMPRAALPDGRYHDIVATMETSIRTTQTRVLGFTRYVRHGAGSAFRYDLQVRQGVPCLPRHTGTDWTLIVALRNMFEEPRDDDGLEQVVLVNPPRRVVGGVSVRF